MRTGNPVRILKFASAFPSVSDRWYVAAKLATDPLYGAVFAELENTRMPLLDLGCGLGVLAFYLRARGWKPAIAGMDYDVRKTDSARTVAEQMGSDMQFTAGDCRKGLPAHAGSVTVLDILQYFQPHEQQSLLREAARRVVPGGRLIVRSGLASGGWRGRITRMGDRFANLTRWMRDNPVHYPTAEILTSCLAEAGMTGGLRPLWGRTPFNNWLGVWRPVGD